VTNGDQPWTRPSPRRGARRALAMWPLVLVVWLLPQAVFLPAQLVVELGLARRLAALPPQPSSVAEGLLILSREAPQAGAGLGLAVLVGCLALWWWTVLWHAGTTRWHQGGSGRQLRVADLVGVGLPSFWPFLRLSLTALAGLALGSLLVGVPLGLGLARAHRAMAETGMEALVGAALPLALLVLAAVWCATLRGAWLLAADPHRSALRAWWQGLVHSAREPWPSLAAWGLWAFAAVALGLLPLLLGVALPALRGGPGGTLLSAVAGLGRAFSAVALFMSFAPRPDPAPVDASAASRHPEPLPPGGAGELKADS
jgi:hypothetical protein